MLSSSTALALSLFSMTGAGVGVQEEADLCKGNKKKVGERFRVGRLRGYCCTVLHVKCVFVLLVVCMFYSCSLFPETVVRCFEKNV